MNELKIRRILIDYESLIILCLGLSVIVLMTTLIGSNPLNRVVTNTLILIIVTVGLYIFIGNSGVLSFGHIAFMAIGAYGAAWLTCNPMLKQFTMSGLPQFILKNSFPLLPAAIVSALLAAIVAFFVGLVLMRLSGIAAAIGTFAFLIIIYVVYSNWTSVTGGTSSVSGLPIYVGPWISLCWALVTMVAAFLYQRSRYGLALRSSREDMVAAKSAGVNIFRQRLLAFVISAFFVGLGGVMYGSYMGIIDPEAFYLDLTFITIEMLVVGGMNSLSGAVIGVVLISIFLEFLTFVESGVNIGSLVLSLPPGAQQVGLGIVMILILIFRNNGITGNREIRLPRKSKN